MPKKSHRRKQKIYKMIGCSNKTCKNYLGGSPDAPLAYTEKPIHTIPNPFLAYTGKGGSACNVTRDTSIPSNVNASNPAYPNTGPPIIPNTIFNNAVQQRGGCGCGLVGGGRRRKHGTNCKCIECNHVTGCKCSKCNHGTDCKCSKCNHGTDCKCIECNHRNECKCSKCKQKKLKGGNAGIPYPNGTVGSPWTPNSVFYPPGNNNYYSENTYKNDISREMVDVGANRPFLGMKGGKQKQRGGTLSNFIGQDLINLGRQFQFGVGSAYNALAGYSSPVNPLPWKDQLPSKLQSNAALY